MDLKELIYSDGFNPFVTDFNYEEIINSSYQKVSSKFADSNLFVKSIRFISLESDKIEDEKLKEGTVVYRVLVSRSDFRSEMPFEVRVSICDFEIQPVQVCIYNGVYYEIKPSLRVLLDEGVEAYFYKLLNGDI